MYLYCKNQIPDEDPLDRATGINILWENGSTASLCSGDGTSELNRVN